MAKIILDLCGGTGAWSKPYRDAGYEVHVITLPVYDVTRVEFDGYSMQFKRMDVHYDDSLTVLYEDVHGILAAPPCTEFSVAKGAAQRDFAGAMRVVDACLRIIWHCRMHSSSKLAFWAMENPVGFLRQFLGVPAYQFEHWEFGELQLKRTDLWGYFKPPSKSVTQKPDCLIGGRSNGRGWAKPECPPEYASLGLDRAALRAITPAGFAQAFYKANP